VSVLFIHYCYLKHWYILSLRECGRLGVWIHGRVKSKTEKLAPASSLVSIHHLKD